MAIDDPESSTAEDRELARWESEPWSGDHQGPWSRLEDAVEKTRGEFVLRYREAFRAGFRAGRQHGRQNPEGRLATAAREALGRIEAKAIETQLRILNDNQAAAEGRLRALEEERLPDAMRELQAAHRALVDRVREKLG